MRPFAPLRSGSIAVPSTASRPFLDIAGGRSSMQACSGAKAEVARRLADVSFVSIIDRRRAFADDAEAFIVKAMCN